MARRSDYRWSKAVTEWLPRLGKRSVNQPTTDTVLNCGPSLVPIDTARENSIPSSEIRKAVNDNVSQEYSYE